jgi:hypothetical protein
MGLFILVAAGGRAMAVNRTSGVTGQLLINFKVYSKDGIKRMVNGLQLS